MKSKKKGVLKWVALAVYGSLVVSLLAISTAAVLHPHQGKGLGAGSWHDFSFDGRHYRGQNEIFTVWNSIAMAEASIWIQLTDGTEMPVGSVNTYARLRNSRTGDVVLSGSLQNSQPLSSGRYHFHRVQASGLTYRNETFHSNGLIGLKNPQGVWQHHVATVPISPIRSTAVNPLAT